MQYFKVVLNGRQGRVSGLDRRIETQVDRGAEALGIRWKQV